MWCNSDLIPWLPWLPIFIMIFHYFDYLHYDHIIFSLNPWWDFLKKGRENSIDIFKEIADWFKTSLLVCWITKLLVAFLGQSVHSTCWEYCSSSYYYSYYYYSSSYSVIFLFFQKLNHLKSFKRFIFRPSVLFVIVTSPISPSFYLLWSWLSYTPQARIILLCILYLKYREEIYNPNFFFLLIETIFHNVSVWDSLSLGGGFLCWI